MQMYTCLYLTLVWKLSGSSAFGDRLEHLADLESALSNSGRVKDLDEQRLTRPPRRTSPPERCPPGVNAESDRQAALLVDELQHTNRWADWTDAIQAVQDLHRQHRYRVVFFLNMAPEVRPDEDALRQPGQSRRALRLRETAAIADRVS